MFENPKVIDTSNTAIVAIADSAKYIVEHTKLEHGELFSFQHLLDHAKDSRVIELPWFSLRDLRVQIMHLELPQLPPVHIGGLTLDLSLTKHAFFLLLCALLLILGAVYTARVYRKTLVPRGFVNLIETMIVFIRDEIAISNMGPEGIKYVPYLLTTFFYILLMNLAGLVPFGATATSNIMITAGLAIVAFFMIQISAIRSQGMKHYLLHLTGDVHWILWVIMVPIEILGLFTKPFALCMRLFANMSGGHIVILSLIGLILMFRSFIVAPMSVLFVVGIDLLELFVALLQAYIFTMLTSLFMGLGMRAGEQHEEYKH